MTVNCEYRQWGIVDGTPVNIYRLTTPDGAYIELTDYGATWVSAYMPDARGVMKDLLLGYDSPQGYLTDDCYMGATVGRYANRIARATITIEGEQYPLENNDGQNTNHGGFHGWHRRFWTAEIIPSGVRFSLLSPHLEGGFPGEVKVTVEYTLSPDHCVTIHHRAEADRATHICMTNHAYFNLSGTPTPIDDHIMRIFSASMLETDATFIPSGRLVSVIDTPFDFSTAHAIGEHLHKQHQQLEWNRGYNHCYTLGDTGVMKRAAVVSHPASGRKLTVDTTLPAVLFYSAGYLSGRVGKGGIPLSPTTGFCLETQFYPDTPSHVHFPATLLVAGDIYDHTTKYKFDTL